jgi:hypothetical protein
MSRTRVLLSLEGYVVGESCAIESRCDHLLCVQNQPSYKSSRIIPCCCVSQRSALQSWTNDAVAYHSVQEHPQWRSVHDREQIQFSVCQGRLLCRGEKWEDIGKGSKSPGPAGVNQFMKGHVTLYFSRLVLRRKHVSVDKDECTLKKCAPSSDPSTNPSQETCS